MEVSNLSSIADLGAFGVILVVFAVGLWVIYKSISKYIEDKRTEDKEEKTYYRGKIDEKDAKIEKMVEDFTYVIKNDVKDLTIKVETLTEEVRKR